MSVLVKLVFNFAVVFAAITLFILPFYAIFRWRRRGKLPENVGFNHSLELFFDSPEANFLVLFWAMGEATVWFVIPEFLLLLMLFMRVHRKYQLIVYDLVGTAIGSAAAFLIHPGRQAILNLPYVQPGMLAHVDRWYGSMGVFGLVYQPFSGVPYKVFAFLAADHHLFFPLFFLVAVAVRIARYFIAYEVLKALYPVLHRRVYRNYLPLYFVAILFFSVMLLRISGVYK